MFLSVEEKVNTSLYLLSVRVRLPVKYASSDKK